LFYIIETPEQLKKFSEYNLEHSFIEPIVYNDNYHPILTDVCAYYIKPTQSRTGFILPVNHSETLSLDHESILALFKHKVLKAYVYDAKRVMYNLNLEMPLICLKTAKFLETGEILDLESYNQPIQTWLYSQNGSNPCINRIVPISKLAEKYDNFIIDQKSLLNSNVYSKKYFSFYNEALNTVLYNIEREGIKVKGFDVPNLLYMHDGDKVYTHYNQYTATGRPSNAFNNVNFGALNKTDGTREMIVPNNDFILEFDYSSYHPRILANLIGYDFNGEDIHTHLGKMYFEVDQITEDQHNESKKITFKILYNDSNKYTNFAFFNKVHELRNSLWTEYNENGYIKSIITKRPIKGIKSKTQVLPYLLQAYETDRNIIVMKDLQQLLKDYRSKLVLYTYDSFLIDYNKKDGKQLINKIKEITDQDGFVTQVKYGDDYNTMQIIN